MITSALILLGAGAFRALLDLVPSWTMSWLSTGTLGSTIGHYAAMLGNYFPVDVLAGCMGWLLALMLLLFAWRVVTFIWTNLPFKAT